MVGAGFGDKAIESSQLGKRKHASEDVNDDKNESMEQLIRGLQSHKRMFLGTGTKDSLNIEHK
jgi:hypothetical protein